MIIQTLDKKYIVIEYVFSDDHVDRYICQEESGDKRYTVVRVKDRIWIRKAMQFLTEQMENRHFTDFISCFFSETCLYVVLKYAEGISLEDKLRDEDSPLQERMVIGKNILEKMMLLDMPDYFLWDCLRPEAITVSPALEVLFRHGLSRLNDYDQFCFVHVQACMGALYEKLFFQELKQGILPPVGDFYNFLNKGGYQNIREIYTAYDRMCRDAAKLSSQDGVRPHTWSFRLWDRIKQSFVWCRKICAFLLMMLAIVFLIYSVRKSLEEGREKTIFESIGTLQIR